MNIKYLTMTLCTVLLGHSTWAVPVPASAKVTGTIKGTLNSKTVDAKIEAQIDQVVGA